MLHYQVQGYGSYSSLKICKSSDQCSRRWKHANLDTSRSLQCSLRKLYWRAAGFSHILQKLLFSLSFFRELKWFLWPIPCHLERAFWMQGWLLLSTCQVQHPRMTAVFLHLSCRYTTHWLLDHMCTILVRFLELSTMVKRPVASECHPL